MIIKARELQSLLTSLLSEADTVKRNLGKVLTPEEKIRSKISVVNGMTTHAFTMTSVEKLGINPQSKYNTPIGIYFYPLDQERYDQLIKNDLPFVSEVEQFSLVKIKNPDKWLNLGSNKKYDIAKICKSIVSKFMPNQKIESNSDLKQFLEKVAKVARHWRINSACKVFNLTWYISSNLDNSPKIWSRILTFLGFEGVYDPGLGVIYESEPAQLVAFSKSAVENVEMFSTRAIRKNYSINSPSQCQPIFEAMFSRLPEEYVKELSEYLEFLNRRDTWEKYYEFISDDKLSYKSRVDNALNNMKSRISMYSTFILSLKYYYDHKTALDYYPKERKIRQITGSNQFKDIALDLIKQKVLASHEICDLLNIVSFPGNSKNACEVFTSAIDSTKDANSLQLFANLAIFFSENLLGSTSNSHISKLLSKVAYTIAKNETLLNFYVVDDAMNTMPPKWHNYLVKQHAKRLKKEPEIAQEKQETDNAGVHIPPQEPEYLGDPSEYEDAKESPEDWFADYDHY